VARPRTTAKGRRGNREGSVYQRPDGRWCAIVTLETGKRKSLYGRTRADALAKLREAQRRQEQGVDLSAPRMTVGAWLDHWLAKTVTPKAEPTTIEGYEISLRLHIKPYLGRVPLAKLTTEQVETWLHQLEVDGRGARTRHFALQRLRTALNQAVARGHIARNVATLAQAPRQHSRKHAAPTFQDIERLRAAIRAERLEPLMTVAQGAGLRRSEVLGLTWERVDLDGPVPTLTVDKRVNRAGGRLLVREGAKSEAGQRRVPLSPMVVDALKRRRAQQLEERLRAGPYWQGPDYSGGTLTGFVFLSLVGTVLEPRNVYRAWKRVRERAGLDQHTFHGLRHDFGSLLMEQGVPDKVVAELLGHANPAVTRRVYQHASDALQQEAVARLAAAVDGVPRTSTIGSGD
jgi:integrase